MLLILKNVSNQTIRKVLAPLVITNITRNTLIYVNEADLNYLCENSEKWNTIPPTEDPFIVILKRLDEIQSLQSTLVTGVENIKTVQSKLSSDLKSDYNKILKSPGTKN